MYVGGHAMCTRKTFLMHRIFGRVLRQFFDQTTNIGKIETIFVLSITITPQTKKYERTNESELTKANLLTT